MRSVIEHGAPLATRQKSAETSVFARWAHPPKKIAKQDPRNFQNRELKSEGFLFSRRIFSTLERKFEARNASWPFITSRGPCTRLKRWFHYSRCPVHE